MVLSAHAPDKYPVVHSDSARASPRNRGQTQACLPEKITVDVQQMYSGRGSRRKADPEGYLFSFVIAVVIALCTLALIAIPTHTTNELLPRQRKQTILRQRLHTRKGFESSGGPAQHADRCILAPTSQLVPVSFDTDLHFSDEFHYDDDPNDVNLPLAERIFAAYFDEFLFLPELDMVINLTASGFGRGYDARVNPIIAQRALRDFYNSSAISLRSVAMSYTHMDRVRGLRFVLRTNSSMISSHSSSTADTAENKLVYQSDRVIIQRTFDGNCLVRVVPLPSTQENQPVYLVVPYHARPKRMAWFLSRYKTLSSLPSLRLKLIVSTYGMEEQQFRTDFNLTDPLKNDNIMVVSSGGLQTPGFSRAVAIREATRLVPFDALMFITDIDMEIHPMFFQSCVANTIRGSQVYFPVFYNLYPGKKNIGKDKGYWRKSSYGMSCLYRSDFDDVDAYRDAERKYAGWGREDMDLMLLYMNRPWKYQVFRALEPALRHKWHIKHCNRDSMVYEDCLQVSYSSLGSQSLLGQALLARGDDIQNHFARYDEDEKRLAHDDEYYSEFARVVSA